MKLLVAFLTLALLAGCGRPEGDLQTPPRPVITTVVSEPPEGRTRSFTGFVRGEVESPVSFRVDGEIIKLPVNPGDEVETGSLIAKLDTADYELNVRRLESQLKLTEAQLRQAQSEFERVQALFEAETASRSDFDRARAARDEAQAQRDTTGRSLEMARNQVKYGALESPRSGTVISVPVNLYQVVRAGQPVAVLRTDDSMVLEISVAETLAGELAIGRSARVRLEAFSDAEIDAQVSEIGAGLSPLAAVTVKLRLKDHPRGLISGQAGEAEIFFPGEAAEGPRVPLTAVTGETGRRRFVWVVEDGKAHRRPVQTGELVGGELEIIDGLKAGERIVVRGSNRLADGQQVRVIEGLD